MKRYRSKNPHVAFKSKKHHPKKLDSMTQPELKEKIQKLLVEWLSARWDTGLYEDDAKGLYTDQLLDLFNEQMEEREKEAYIRGLQKLKKYDEQKAIRAKIRKDKRKSMGICVECLLPANMGIRCEKHRERHNRQRRIRGS